VEEKAVPQAAEMTAAVAAWRITSLDNIINTTFD